MTIKMKKTTLSALTTLPTLLSKLALTAFFCCSISSALAQGEVVRLGQVLPMTGPLANVGKEIKASTEAAIAQHNLTSKPRIEFLVEDDANNPELTAEAVDELSGGKATALLSCFGTVSCLVQMKRAQAAGLPLIGPIAGATQLRGRSALGVYPVRASATEELARLIQFSQTMSLGRLAVVIQDDGFGQGYWTELKALLIGSGLQVIATDLLNPAAPDYARVATKLKKESPQALMLLANATHSVGVLKAWREQGNLPFVMNLSGQANGLFANGLKGYAGAAAFVVTTPSPWEKRLQIQRDYQAAMQAANITNLSYLSFESYINARVAIEAAKRAQKKTPAGLKLALQDTELVLGGLDVGFGNKARARYTDMSLLRPDGTFKQ
jgi:branched-chain amino acid transport system substrate-binding protein